MMQFIINRADLEKALEKLDLVSKNGFTHSDAVFAFVSAGPSIGDSRAEFQDLILKAHPTDPSQNWGRGACYEDAILVDGKFGWKDE